MSTVSVTYFDRERVERALAQYVRDVVVCHPEIEEIVLFGSLVTGTPVPGSDVDLLLIVSRSDRTFPDRIPQFLPTGFPIGVDVFPYTREEVERMTRQGNTLVLDAMRRGVTLFKR